MMPKRRTLSEALSRTVPHGPAAAAPIAPKDGGSATWLIQPIDITAIRTRTRLRAVLDDGRIEAIAESLAAIGLQSPILVRPSEPGDDYTLVAGAHRLAAARRLGWEAIDARICLGSLDEMRLIEIDENLARAELTPLDRARFVAERKRVYLRMNPERTHGGDRRSAAYRQKMQTDTMSDCSPSDTDPCHQPDIVSDCSAAGTDPGHQPDIVSDCSAAGAGPDNQSATVSGRSFAADAGDRAGLSERTIYRALEIGENLDPDLALALAPTPLAHREGDLRKIARMPPDAQRSLIQKIASLDSPPRTLRDISVAGAGQATDAPSPAPSQSALPALKRAWRRADTEERQHFQDWIREQGWLTAH